VLLEHQTKSQRRKSCRCRRERRWRDENARINTSGNPHRHDSYARRDLRPHLRLKPQPAARLRRTAGDLREHRSAIYLLFNCA